MARYKIAWLPGDGVGTEVLDAARVVLEKTGLDAELIHGDIGWEFWCKEGDALPARTIDLLKNVDAAMFGAVTSKPVRQAELDLTPELKSRGLVYRSPIVRVRQQFDLFTCLRPCKAYPGNPLNFAEHIDLVIFRENTEDLYAGVEFNPVPRVLSRALAELSTNFAPFEGMAAEDLAISCKINTRMGSERILEAAFEFAEKRPRRKLTVVHKANVVRASDGLFLETARRLAHDHPAVQVDDANVDAMTMWLLKNPLSYDVLVAPNLYGDVISDMAAQLVGGLGFACSGNIGRKLGVFEPSHGSAPKYAGLNKVNPIATILAAKMMLEWLGEQASADRIEKAVAEVIREGSVRTYDMGGTASTMDMARAVVSRM